MAQGKRDRLSTEQRIDMWRRWKAGESLHEIGRAFGKGHGSIRFLLTQRGGIVPAARRRSLRTLTLAEREDISRGIASGLSIREIANGLQRAVSTVSREVSRHGGRPLYRASEADSQAWESALRPKVCLLATHVKLRTIATDFGMVEDTVSQEREHARVPRNHLPQLIHPGTRSVEKGADSARLRSKRLIRRSLHSRADGQSRGQIVDAISIRERPAEIEDRAIPGHWQGDLLGGTKNSHIATLVERHSRFTILVKVPSKDTATVVAALSRHVRKLPASLRRSLTWDRGLEMAKHKSFTVATNVKVFFCDPQSPWQRGTNENTNRLLRQYFPKKTDLSGYSQSDLDKVALRLNQRPRKTLGFETPATKLQASVAAIH